MSILLAYERLKTKENCKFLALKWSRSHTRDGRLLEVPNIVIWLGNFWYFGKLVTEDRWSLARRCHNRSFDCTANRIFRKQRWAYFLSKEIPDLQVTRSRRDWMACYVIKQFRTNGYLFLSLPSQSQLESKLIHNRPCFILFLLSLQLLNCLVSFCAHGL